MPGNKWRAGYLAVAGASDEEKPHGDSEVTAEKVCWLVAHVDASGLCAENVDFVLLGLETGER